MRLSTKVVVLATAAFSGIVEAVLEDKYLFNNADLYWGAALRDLPTPSRTIVKKPYGQLPKSCLEEAVNKNRCDRYNIEVFDITYSDCETPWIICRCRTVASDYSIEIIADNIGKLPVGARSWVRQFHFWDTTTGGGGQSTGNDITTFGSWPSSTILFHEAGHNLDAWYASGVTLPPAGWFSASQAWQNLSSLDTCIPTAYARSWAESFAELGTQAFYEENVGPIPIGTQCMDDFLTTARRVLRGAINRYRYPRCLYRFSPGTLMCAGPTARAAGACEGLLDLGQIPNKRDESGTTVSDFPNERLLNRSERDAREFEAQVERAHPRDIKGREVYVTKDTPSFESPTAINKRQSASYKLQLCEHADYAGRCVSLPASYGVCHTIIGENEDWASSAKAGSGGKCTLYKQHRCLAASGTLAVGATGVANLYPVGFDNKVRSFLCTAV